MDYNKLFQPAPLKRVRSLTGSKKFKMVLSGIGGIIIVLLIFKIGMVAGFKKASFSYRWGENYHRNFAGPKQGFFNDVVGDDFIESHGVFGQIIEVASSTEGTSTKVATIIIRGQDNVEKIVIVNKDTVIRRFQDNIMATELKVDENIVVIGEPNDSGQIEAKLIRVFPSPPPKPMSSGPFAPKLRIR